MDLTRAMELLSGLADGINPLTGEILPDDCVCNQAEIVRALNAVLTAIPASKANPLHLNAGRPWTAIEEDKLADEYDSGMKLSEIAREHGRTRGAIEGRLLKMGKIEKAHFSTK